MSYLTNSIFDKSLVAEFPFFFFAFFCSSRFVSSIYNILVFIHSSNVVYQLSLRIVKVICCCYMYIE